jgi:flagellar hook protein FlgE
MRIESALYTSREGISAHGGAISAIGDNISNVNTPGFKGQRVEFANLVADGMSGGITTQTEGTGNGVRITTVRQLHSSGTIEPTGRDLDVAISGSGFFNIGTPESIRYTRAGNFGLDSAGNLVTVGGQSVLGYAYDNGVPATELSAINMLDFETTATATTTADITANLNAGLAIGTAPAAPASFNELADGASYITSVDAIDSLGQSHDIILAFTKTAANTFTAQAYIDGEEVGGAAGTPVLLGETTLTFDGTGLIPEANQGAAQLVLAPAYGNGADAGNITLSLANFSQFSGASGIQNVNTNGVASGALRSYEFQANGDIIAVLDNGQRVSVANVAVSTFTNLDGLQKLGDNLYTATADAGTISVGQAGLEGRGSIAGAALERSTVDMSTEFTNLVLYQKGYQANSKLMNMVDQMIDQALSMLR